MKKENKDNKNVKVIKINLFVQVEGTKKEKDKEENRVYTYIRNGMKVQSQMMNICISELYNAIKDKLYEKNKKAYKELKNSYGRLPTEKNKESSPYSR